jgi:hypothetical protein
MNMIKMIHRFPSTSRLRITWKANIYSFTKLPISLQQVITDVSRPILYQSQPYFPRGFQQQQHDHHKLLALAYQGINQTTGWTISSQDESSRGISRTCYVGEHDNGQYKIRLEVHCNNNNQSFPDLITAYPVSRVDPHWHSDFLSLDGSSPTPLPWSLHEGKPAGAITPTV